MRATITPLPQPGHALLRITELDATAEGLAIAIQRQQGPDIHLGEDGWRRTEAWLVPDRVTRRGEALEFHLGPAICDRLAGVATIRLRVREPDIGVVGVTVTAWPAMLTSGAIGTAPASEPEPVRQPEPPPPPEPAPPVEPPRPTPDLRAARDPQPETRRSGGTGWMIALVLLLIAGGAGYYVWTNHIAPPMAPEKVAAAPAADPAPAQKPPAPQKSAREEVADYLATKPSPDAMLAKGRDYAKEGKQAAAFLVFRQAAEQGNAAAQLELASYYDPLDPPKAGFPHDGLRAADWYERAALAGLADAQRRLGLLLAKGGAGLSVDVAKAKGWLQQAASQNDAEAKKALDALPR